VPGTDCAFWIIAPIMRQILRAGHGDPQRGV